MKSSGKALYYELIECSPFCFWKYVFSIQWLGPELKKMNQMVANKKVTNIMQVNLR